MYNLYIQQTQFISFRIHGYCKLLHIHPYIYPSRIQNPLLSWHLTFSLLYRCSCLSYSNNLLIILITYQLSIYLYHLRIPFSIFLNLSSLFRIHPVSLFLNLYTFHEKCSSCTSFLITLPCLIYMILMQVEQLPQVAFLTKKIICSSVFYLRY